MKKTIVINEEKYEFNTPEKVNNMEVIHIKTNNESKNVIWNRDLNAFFFSNPKEPNILYPKAIKNVEIQKEQLITTTLFNKRNTIQQIKSQSYFSHIQKNAIKQKNTKNQLKINSPLTGKIIQLISSTGKVQKGQTLCVIDAMKMENKILAPFDGILSAIHISKDQPIKTGEIMFSLKNHS